MCSVDSVAYQFVKVGYAGENFPRHIFPSMVGRPILRAEEEVAKGVVLKVKIVQPYPSLFFEKFSSRLSPTSSPSSREK